MPVLFTEIIVLEGMESKEDQWCKWIGLQKEVFIYCISHLRNVGPWFWFSAGGGCVTLWKQNKTVQSKKLVIWLASDSKKVVWLFLHVTAMSNSSVTITWKIKGGKKKRKKFPSGSSCLLQEAIPYFHFQQWIYAFNHSSGRPCFEF